MWHRVVAMTIIAWGVATAAFAFPQDAPPPAPTPCSTPQARQFDFWAGEWTVTAKDRVVGHNNIHPILNGCVLLEQYTDTDGSYAGKSFNYYDEADGHWHQVWVDTNGLHLYLSGGFADGKMVMSGEHPRKGKTIHDRLTWYDNADGTVRQVWEQSQDGETWKVVFDGLYAKKQK